MLYNDKEKITNYPTDEVFHKNYCRGHNTYTSFNKLTHRVYQQHILFFMYSMCSLVVSVLDSPAVDPRSNPGSGSALLMSEKSQAVYYISNCHMLIDKALSSDKPNGYWFEADWLYCKRDELSSNRKDDGSRLTGSTQACHS